MADAERRLRAALLLLKERHEFTEYPMPAEGEMSDPQVWYEREQWLARWGDLGARVHAALDAVAPADK